MPEKTQTVTTAGRLAHPSSFDCLLTSESLFLLLFLTFSTQKHLSWMDVLWKHSRMELWYFLNFSAAVKLRFIGRSIRSVMFLLCFFKLLTKCDVPFQHIHNFTCIQIYKYFYFYTFLFWCLLEYDHTVSTWTICKNSFHRW